MSMVSPSGWRNGAGLGMMALLVFVVISPTTSSSQNPEQSGVQNSTKDTAEDLITLFDAPTLRRGLPNSSCRELLCQYKEDKCTARSKSAEAVAQEQSCNFAIFFKNGAKHMQTTGQYLLYSEPVKWCMSNSKSECFARKFAVGCSSDEKEMEKSNSIPADPCLHEAKVYLGHLVIADPKECVPIFENVPLSPVERCKKFSGYPPHLIYTIFWMWLGVQLSLVRLFLCWLWCKHCDSSKDPSNHIAAYSIREEPIRKERLPNGTQGKIIVSTVIFCLPLLVFSPLAVGGKEDGCTKYKQIYLMDIGIKCITWLANSTVLWRGMSTFESQDWFFFGFGVICEVAILGWNILSLNTEMNCGFTNVLGHGLTSLKILIGINCISIITMIVIFLWKRNDLTDTSSPEDGQRNGVIISSNPELVKSIRTSTPDV